MTNELVTQLDASAVEQVLISGDLSKLSSPQRVQYYKSVCESVGLNPLTKPFDYISLNGKLTLYAKKDATDQLRSIKGVSIDDVDLTETGEHFIVKVKGHDNTGRSDVEIGVVSKKDMQGNLGNAQMKAVTKAKRRLTLSLCGLGWLDETEVETIPDAKVVTVEPETGEILTAAEEFAEEVGAVIEPKAMSLESAKAVKSSDGSLYGDASDEELNGKLIGVRKALKKEVAPERKEQLLFKRDAILTIQKSRKEG